MSNSFDGRGELQGPAPRVLGLNEWMCEEPGCRMLMPISHRHQHLLQHMEAEKTAPPKETVNHPNHYGGDTVYETIKVLKAWLTHDEYIGFLKGNVIKYLSRARKKNGNEDIAKATWYQNELAKYTKEHV